MAEKDTRGTRTNNPGNIKKSPSKWVGMAPDQPDAVNVTFSRPVYGLRAMAILLRYYQNKLHLNSVSDIIHRWAPRVENDTDSYVAYVCLRMSVRPHERIDLSDETTLLNLMKIIVNYENGYSPYPDSLFHEALAMLRAG